MAETTIALILVEPIREPIGDEIYGDYVRCDFCHETAVADIWEGKAETDWRTFHRQQGGRDDGLVVCSNCLDAFLSEPMQ
jgi:hypothetical protein